MAGSVLAVRSADIRIVHLEVNMGEQMRISLEEAVEKIKKRTARLTAMSKKLEDINGEVAAEDILAANDQPPFPRSPLDGYALRGEDTEGASGDAPVKLRVIGKLCAGDSTPYCVNPGEAVRIMTGAPIPQGANAVIRQEDTDYGETEVQLYRAVKPFQNYCCQGEDYRKGDLLIEKGTVWDHTAAALAASNGISEIRVYPKPHIAVLVTGDELVEPGRPLTFGKIYNSNVTLIRSRLRELGITCVSRHVPDETRAVKEEILRRLETVDGIITTGGVSVGEKDIMNEVLPELNAEILFEGIAMKPGSPAKYAVVKGKPLLALSGNPFAAAATLELLGRPMLAALSGNEKLECIKKKAQIENSFPKSSPQRRFIRGTYRDGKVTIPHQHSSGQLASMLGCNCMVDIPENSGPVCEGSDVTVWML